MFVIETPAPLRTLPLTSPTRPQISPVFPCANAGVQLRSARANNSAATNPAFA